jgi:SRSO17 transposase
MEVSFEQRKREMLAECAVEGEELAAVTERLAAFVEPFAESLATREQREYACDYVVGLSSHLERKNVESIAYYHEQDRQALQRFIGSAAWDHRPLLDKLARQVGQELGEADGVLILDPSAFTKKGQASVGVQRQWNGRLGKVDNCQVGVYLAYSSRRGAALTNERLYLPKSWTSHPSRCRQCGVPPEIGFATKLDQALEMISEHGPHLPHAWVVGDDEFGRSTQFRRNLRAVGEQYLLAVPSNTLIRDRGTSESGESADPAQKQGPFQRVDRWAAALPAEAWTTIEVRDGEKGPVLLAVAVTRVLAITERTREQAAETVVVTRREENGQTVGDYFLSNAPVDTPRAEFARVANSRQRVEQCFQFAKGETGLADYEVRTWHGWHHHQTLSLLAAWFLTLETKRGKKDDPGHHRAPTPHRPRTSSCPSLRPRSPSPHRTRMPGATGTQRTRPLLSPQNTPTSAATKSCAEKLSEIQ